MNKFELNGVTYTRTEKGYFYKTTGAFDKKGNELTMRIAKHVFEQAFDEFVQTHHDEWEAQADAELKNRKEAQANSDEIAEKAFNKKDAKKPRKSKDIAHETDGVTLTAKQVDFIRHIPDTNFYEDGLESTMWCDVLADEIGGQFAGKPMTVGAMISTLKEKNLIYVSVAKVNGKKAKYFGFTELGKKVASELGLN